MDVNAANSLLVSAYYGNSNEEQVKAAFFTLANSNQAGDILVEHSKMLSAKPYRQDILSAAIPRILQSKHPGDLLNAHALLEERADYSEVIKKAASRASTGRDAAVVIEHLNVLDQLKDIKNTDSIVKTAFFTAAGDTEQAHLIFDTATLKILKKKPYHEEVLRKAFFSITQGSQAYKAIYAMDELKHKPYCDEILEKVIPQAAKNTESAPYVIKNKEYFKNKTYEDSALFDAYATTATYRGSEIFQHIDALKNKPYYNQVMALAATNKESALKIVEVLNENHAQPPGKRFAWLQYLNAAQNFNLITMSSAEVFTSTYQGVLDDLLADVKKSGKPLTALLSREQMKSMDVFLEAAASYNRLPDVLRVIPKEQFPAIIDRMMKNIAAAGDDLRYSQTLVMMMLAMKDQPELRHLLETQVKHHTQHANSLEARDQFGLLASAYGSKCTAISPDMKPFFLGMAQTQHFALPPMRYIDRNALAGRDGKCNQLMVFADDADSKSSFTNFTAAYQNKPNWKIEDRGSYLHISSTGGAGMPVHIYANKPDHHDDGLAAIRHDAPSCQMFIGRGHSYYAGDYLPLITNDMKLVHLGSCGGFQNMRTVLKNSPSAQMIVTQKTGSMHVNDPLLFSINESIRTTGKVDWQVQQTKLEQLSSEHKDSYLLPHKNIPAIMQRAYMDADSARDQQLLRVKKETGIADEKGLDRYIRDRGSIHLSTLSNGVIEQDELAKILTVAKVLGKQIKVTQNEGAPDQITVIGPQKTTTYQVNLDRNIKSR